MPSLPVLVVDDEPDLRELLCLTLERMQLQALSAANLAEAQRIISQNQLSLVLTDMNLPDGNGLDLVRSLSQSQPELPVVVITAYGNMDTAIQALKAGAFDFLAKPVDLSRIKALVGQAIRLQQPSPMGQKPMLLGQSSVMQQLRQMINRLARNQAPVYIQGESGTGKELVARSLHQQGPRSDQPFVAVNCGAIPTELMESEFFGHMKGAFTGAHQDKQGFFQAAHGGTLFLDEIAELPMAMQIKLLRAIQERAVRPVGANRELHIDVRIISATHFNLAELVEQGRFRQDLYYRLHVIDVRLPPLREHPEDIAELAEHALNRICERYGQGQLSLTPYALQELCQYSFPGNVRELENLLERAVALCDDREINTVLGYQQAITSAAGSDQTQLQGMAADAQPPLASSQLRPMGTNLDDWLAGLERQEIKRALAQTRWNRTEAAKVLGISFRSLRYKLKKLAIE